VFEKCTGIQTFKYSYFLLLELELLHRCLDPIVDRRPSPADLLQSDLLGGRTHQLSFRPPAFPTLEMRCRKLELPIKCRLARPLDYLTVREIYYLWQLAGGDVFAELRKHGLMITTPPVISVPSLVVGEGQVGIEINLCSSDEH
jgi:hypothetical protein